jgi:hypothetical protein
MQLSLRRGNAEAIAGSIEKKIEKLGFFWIGHPLLVSSVIQEQRIQGSVAAHAFNNVI